MVSNFLRLFMVVCLASWGAAEGRAQADPTFDGITVDQMAEALQANGYRAKIGTTSSGLPEIESSSQGVTFWTDFYGCDEATPKVCTSISIVTVLSPDTRHSLDLINAFNTQKRYVSADVAEDGKTSLTMDIEVAGGITRKNLLNWIEWWETQLGHFLKHIDW